MALQFSGSHFSKILFTLSCLLVVASFSTVAEASCSPSCLPGFYYYASNDTCLQCSAGNYCPGGGNASVACSSGTFNENVGKSDSSACIACTAGKKCPTTVVAESCLAGTYSTGSAISCSGCSSGAYQTDVGQTSCLPCPAGKTCATASASPVNCLAGTYSTGSAISCSGCSSGAYQTDVGQTSCLPCPAGKTCATASASPVNCTAGTFSVGSAISCTSCEAGYYCPSTSSNTKVACTVGSYSLGSQSICTGCPAGSACPVTTSGPVACSVGQYSNAGSSACVPCPAGSKCPDPALAPEACPLGTYSLQGFNNCTLCPAGYACTSADAVPSSCVPGTYSIAGNPNCTECAPGFSCPSTTTATFVQCPDGTYSTGGQASCTQCPSGSYCPYKNQAVIVACPAGQYSSLSSANCTECAKGWECPSTTGSSNSACKPGTYSVGGQQYCISCPAGSRCPYTDQAVIIACSTGTYALGASYNCTDCPAGYSCASTSSGPSATCSLGTYSIAGQADCTSCPAGYYCPSPSTATVTPCPDGTYSLGGRDSCVDCTIGYSCYDPSNAPLACGSGSYSLGRQKNCTACPAGSQCPSTAGSPQLCPVGYYSSGGAVSCQPCSPGYYCALGSTTSTPNTQCQGGGYCAFASQFTACPAGTYGNKTGGISQADACIACPAGYFCVQGTSDFSSSICPPGFYCPEGTQSSSQHPCPPGFYNPNTGLVMSSQCIVCEAGRYCPLGSTHTNNTCHSGYFCPAQTGDYLANPCPAGTFSGAVTSLSDSASCQKCTPGSYCPAGSVQPTACSAGTYNPYVNATSILACLSCEAGKSCPSAGLSAPSDTCQEGHYCPTGTAVKTQNPCPPGTYTNQTDAFLVAHCIVCPPGYACVSGTGGINNPPLDCAQGHYCPASTSYTTQFDCPAGTYTQDIHLHDSSECSTCLPSFYCLSGRHNMTGYCSAGYYCPAGTKYATEYPCPAGSYSTATDLSASGQCLPCTVGHYCPAGTVTPNECPGGRYANDTSTTSSTACPVCPGGFYCPQATVNPLVVGIGNYSDDGAAVQSPCQAGHYCDWNSTSRAVMLASKRCMGGTYCPASSSKAPTFQDNGCAVAFYCPEATALPIECPAGTYNPSTNQNTSTDCIDCPAGSYCLQGVSNITGTCAAGHYCPAKSTGSMEVPCPGGYYRSLTGGTSLLSCAVCTSGSYCPQASTTPTLCLAGHYCVTGASVSEPCPIGTFANTTGLRQVEECSECPAGQFCDGMGQSQPRGLCDPGFYCTRAQYTSAPRDGTDGGKCTRGNYCPQGSYIPTPCPAGTYNNITGAKSLADCGACDPGKYCAGLGNTQITGICTEGYYCDSAATNPTFKVTPPGYISLAGAAAPTPCNPGYYNAEYGRTVCVPCPPGFYCPTLGNKNVTDCPIGHYCPSLSITASPCAAGYMGPQTNMQNSSACQPCTPGYFCASTGQGNVTGPCSAGFYCLNGSSIPNPTEIVGGRCPHGFYCPPGTATPLPCTEPGYFCAMGATIGAVQPVPCAPGYYQPIPGNSWCYMCQKGYKCVENSTAPTVCPKGFYCLDGNQNSGIPLTCPEGTYGSVDGLKASSDCTACPAGEHCVGGERAGGCNIGYFCASNAPAANPNDSTTNYGPCPMHHYCGVNTSVPLTCPNHTYNPALSGKAITDCLPCPAGYQCLYPGSGAVVCSAGSYCEEGKAPTSCPQGTYNPLTQQYNATACLTCPAGYLCDFAGTSSPVPCPAGYICPNGTVDAVPCPGGYYRSSTMGISISDCVQCGAGTYCPPGSPMPAVCPIGHYCPVLQGWANLCPAGTFAYNTSTDRTDMNATCKACGPGTYSATDRGSCVDCSAGYVCLGGAVTATPENSTQGGYPCPAGYYCLAGATSATPCPKGTLRTNSAGVALTDCVSCPANTFGNEFGLSACLTCGPSSYSLAGSNTCLCNGTYRSFQKSDRACVCQPGYEFYDETLQLREGDSTVDCQPVVFERCAQGLIRTPNGACVTPGGDCKSRCVSGAGTYDSQSGLCICGSQPDPNTLCDSNCRTNQAYIEQSNILPFDLKIVDPATNYTGYVSLSKVTGVYSSLSCDGSNGVACKFSHMRMSGYGFSGVYNPGLSYLRAVLGVAVDGSDETSAVTMSIRDPLPEFMLQDLKLKAEELAQPGYLSDKGTAQPLSSQRRVILAASGYNTPSQIYQPVVCLSQGEGLIFELGTGDHYPVYVKDSLLNTNPSFDYGAFRRLSEKLNGDAATKASVDAFAFSFLETGVYVFKDAGSTATLETIVRVVSAEESCPLGSANIMPVTTNNLVSIGVRKNSNILLAPDWVLIGVLLGGVVVLVSAVSGGLWYFRKKSWLTLSGCIDVIHMHLKVILMTVRFSTRSNVHFLDFHR